MKFNRAQPLPMLRDGWQLGEATPEGARPVFDLTGAVRGHATAAEAAVCEHLAPNLPIDALLDRLSRSTGGVWGAEAVWQVLDTLADRGWLNFRHAPPTGRVRLARRVFLGRMAPVALAASTPGAAFAIDSLNVEAGNKEAIAKASPEAVEKAGKEPDDESRELRDKQSESFGKGLLESEQKGEQQKEGAEKNVGELFKTPEQREKNGEQTQKGEQAGKEAAGKGVAEQNSKLTGELTAKGGGGSLPPIPEPSTLTLLGAGALAVAAHGWMRRRGEVEQAAKSDDAAANPDA